MMIRLSFIAMFVAVISSTHAASVQISVGADNSRTITGQGYEALVASDGCLTNLRIDGQEFLKPGVNISRGSYFYQGGALRLPSINQPSKNAINASSERAEVHYEFEPSAMVWTVTNKTDQAMVFFLIFDTPGVSAVINDKGEVTKPPTAQNWQKTIWFCNKARLEITGSSRLWGPWEKRYQVWEAALKPKETRKIEFKIGQASEAEMALIAKLGNRPVTAPPLNTAPAKPVKPTDKDTKQQPPATTPAPAEPKETQPTGAVTGTVTEISAPDLILKITRDGDAKRVLVYNLTIFTEVFVAGKPAKIDDIKKDMKITVVTTDAQNVVRIDTK